MLVKVLQCIVRFTKFVASISFNLSRTFSRTPQKQLDVNLIIYMYTRIGTCMYQHRTSIWNIPKRPIPERPQKKSSFTCVYKNLSYNRQDAEAILLIFNTVSILFLRTDCKGFHHFIKVHQLPS